MSRVAQIAGMCLSALVGATAAAANRAEEESEPREPQPLDTLRDFDAVTLSGPDTLLVSEGEDWSVAVEGDPDAIARLDFAMQNRVLNIGRRRTRGWAQDDDGAIVRVTLPRLRRVSLAGSGDLRAEGMTGDRVEAALAGSGDLVLRGVAARAVRLDVAGSGMLSAAGTAEECRVSIAGSGDVRADGLVAARASVSVAGSGAAAIHASEAASVSIAGSGNVHVIGTQAVRVSKIGSGEVHCAL